MKKFWNYKLWWRIPCAIFMLIGLLAIVLLTYAAIEDGPDLRIATYERLSPMVQEQHKRGKLNLINAQTGKRIVSDITTYWNVSTQDSMYWFCKDDKCGFVNLNTGKIAIPAQYDNAWIFSEGLAAVVVDNRLGFIRPDGSWAIPLKFAYHRHSFQEVVFLGGHCAVADSTNRFGIIDTNGEWVIAPQYEKITLGQDYFIVSEQGEFNKQIAYDGTILNTNLIENVYDLDYDDNYYDAEYGYDVERTITNLDYFMYQVGDRYGLMNAEGQFLTKPIYMRIYGLKPTIFQAMLQDYHSVVLLDGKGNVISNK